MTKSSVMRIYSIDRNVIECEVWVFVMKKDQNGIYQETSVIDRFDKEIVLDDDYMDEFTQLCNERQRMKYLSSLMNK